MAEGNMFFVSIGIHHFSEHRLIRSCTGSNIYAYPQPFQKKKDFQKTKHEHS